MNGTGNFSKTEQVLAYFTELGTNVDQRWSTRGRRSGQLSEIATVALEEIPLPEGLTVQSILCLMSAGVSVPKQRPSSDGFGQPPTVMYQNHELEIQAITWMEGTTSTHQHGFDGAFRVASGSSLHVQYAFSEQELLADRHVVAGQLSIIESEILRTGDVRPIVSGPEFIHSLFHLERPSMTIVVRNRSSGHPFPQYDYRLPGVGFDVLARDDRLQMRLRGLHTLYRLDRSQAASVAREAVASEELWTAFSLCDDWALTYGATKELVDLVEILGKRANALEALLTPMYREEIRRGRLLARRGLLREPRHRLLLALIVNLPDHASIETSMAQLFPGEDSSRVIIDLIGELSSPQYRGISGLTFDPDESSFLKSQLDAGSAIDVLGLVVSKWNPPSVLEALLT
jgi:hypothetical protein